MKEQELNLNYFAHSNYQNSNHLQNMQQKQRITRISLELNKLNSLIELTKNQSILAFQLLKNCQHSSSSSSSHSHRSNHHNVSEMFEETDSRSTILITPGMAAYANNNAASFHDSKSLEMSRPIQSNHNQDNSRNHFDLHASHLSSEGFKDSAIEISEIKPVDTTVKKAKLVKSNMQKQKKTLFDKERVLSKNQKAQKINRIKSQNKLISNTSTFKRGINIIKEQLNSVKKQKQNKTIGQMQHNISIPNKNYLSNKIETLNSKRNLKYNSVSKADSKHEKIEKCDKVEKMEKNSKSKFHINLQKQVTMKITDLKIKKNLCLVETSYLSASVKVTKEEITAIEDSSNKYSDETLLKYFILKSIIKFISQYNDETWTNSQDIQIDNETVSNTINKPQKFIKIINKLPDILRRKNIVSESICKDFIEDKSFIDQKLNNLATVKGFQKQPLYIYLCELHLYIEFLLNNNMIHETKRHKIFNPTSEEFFSDRSAKEMKLTNNSVKETKFESKNKDLSERKKPGTAQLKRVNTSKALKKGVTATKPKKV